MYTNLNTTASEKKKNNIDRGLTSVANVAHRAGLLKENPDDGKSFEESEPLGTTLARGAANIFESLGMLNDTSDTNEESHSENEPLKDGGTRKTKRNTGVHRSLTRRTHRRTARNMRRHRKHTNRSIRRKRQQAKRKSFLRRRR